jgi:hypothetical protein
VIAEQVGTESRFRLSPLSGPEERLVAADRVNWSAAVQRLEGLFPDAEFAERVRSSGSASAAVISVPAATVDRLAVLGDLDRAMSTADMTHGRLRLASGPADAHAAALTAARGNVSPRLAAAFPLAQAVLDGDTLILNQVELATGGTLLDVCGDLGVAYRSSVGVNAYIAHGPSPGFGVHWDDHDVLVVQIDGRKYWEIHEPVTVGSLREFHSDAAAGRVVWSGILEVGQALIIPRGWAHVASGLDATSSVHLTISIPRQPPTDAFGKALQDSQVRWSVRSPVDGQATVRELLEHGIGMWRQSLPVFPTTGAIRSMGALAGRFESQLVRLRLQGGVVFKAGEPELTLCANATELTLDDAGVDVVCSLLESNWVGREALAETSGQPLEVVVQQLNRLCRVGWIELGGADV